MSLHSILFSILSQLWKKKECRQKKTQFCICRVGQFNLFFFSSACYRNPKTPRLQTFIYKWNLLALFSYSASHTQMQTVQFTGPHLSAFPRQLQDPLHCTAKHVNRSTSLYFVHINIDKFYII